MSTLTGSSLRRRGPRTGTLRGAAFRTGLLLLLASAAAAQTLARPGWAGSGMKVTQWWRSSVIVEVAPGVTSDGTVLHHTRLQLGDLQTLGTDAVLLRGIDPGAAPAAGHTEPQLAPEFGTLDEFDQLMREASGRRIRLLVEVPAALSGDALAADARFWLNRGVSGLYLAGDPGADKARALRAVLHSYVGDRVLVGDAPVAPVAAGAGQGAAAPDLFFSALRGFGADTQPTDVAALRSSIEAARRSSAGGGVGVAEIDPKAPPVTGEEAKARATALLIVRGSVALRAQDVGVGPEEQARLGEAQRDAAEQRAIASATSPAAASNARRAAAARKAAAPTALDLPGDATFSWYRRMIGLHRGNAAMLEGDQTLLNQDAQGTLVSVWQGRGGQPLVAVVNLRREPAKLPLEEDFTRLRLRGHFLRTVVRSDTGMGAMPLGNVSVPGFGVYLGQLGR